MVTERLRGRLGYRVVLKKERASEGAVMRRKGGCRGRELYTQRAAQSCTQTEVVGSTHSTGCREGMDRLNRYLDFSLKRNAAGGDRGRVTTTSCGVTYRHHYILWSCP